MSHRFRCYFAVGDPKGEALRRDGEKLGCFFAAFNSDISKRCSLLASATLRASARSEGWWPSAKLLFLIFSLLSIDNADRQYPRSQNPPVAVARARCQRRAVHHRQGWQAAGKVVPLETPEAGQVRRLGFMAGQIAVPDGTAPASRPHNGYDGRSPCEWQPVNAVAIRDDKLPAFAGQIARDRAVERRARRPPVAIRNRPPPFA